MLNIIQQFVNRFINTDDKQKIALETEYTRVLYAITQSKTLAQLFNTQKMILTHSNALKKINSSDVSTAKIEFLHKQWQHKYKMWKLQSRG